jgi:hypothetical protein
VPGGAAWPVTPRAETNYIIFATVLYDPSPLGTTMNSPRSDPQVAVSVPRIGPLLSACSLPASWIELVGVGGTTGGQLPGNHAKHGK